MELVKHGFQTFFIKCGFYSNPDLYEYIYILSVVVGSNHTEANFL